MSPSLESGQLTFGNRLAYRSKMPERGDVIAVKIEQTGDMILKRVIGLPGERVSMYCGTVFINRVPLNEPYVKFAEGLSMSPLTLDNDEYWVIGDNRIVSAFGVVYHEEIVAQTIL